MRQWLVAVVIAGVALGGLIGGQLLFPTPTFALTPSANMPDSGTEAAAAGSTGHAGHDHQENDASETPPPVGAFYRWEDGRRVVACDFTDVVLDPRQQPMLGPPDASHLVILMFDYTCSHCHAMHELLQLARSRYGDQLGVLLVTWPIDAACNSMIPADTATARDGACEYAKLAIALWRISPEAFQTFDSWVVSFDQSPPLDLGIRKAIDLVGRERLQEELAKPQITQTLQRNLRFTKPLADHFRTVPIVLLENRYLTGVPERYDQFYQILERELGLKAPSSRPLQP